MDIINSKHIKFDAGILLCGTIREYLESEVFKGRAIKFREGRGWISRTFEISGAAQDVTHVDKTLRLWASRLDDSGT